MKFLPCFVMSLMVVWMSPGNSAPLHLETSRIPLSTENATTKFVGKLEYRGGLKLRSEHEKFGGLSGMAVNFPEDGNLLSGWVRQKNRWRPFDYVQTELFQPTGAAVLPSGDVVMLERRFTFLGGFASRLSLISANEIKPGATLRGQEIGRLEPPLLDENFEGAAAYKNEKGETIIYIVSDDNFFPLQSTLLLMFKLTK